MKKYFVLFLMLSGCSGIVYQELPNLSGQTTEQIRSAYGKPAIIRHEGDIQLWSYHQDNCSTLIFFDSSQHVQYAENCGQCP